MLSDSLILMEDPFESCIKNYNSSLIVQDTACDLVIKLSNFSRENVSPSNQSPDIEYYTSSIYFENYFWIKVYSNGINKEDKDHISIYFCCTEEYNSINIVKYFKFDCIISVLDVEGSKRFSQSFGYEYFQSSVGNRNILPVFGFDRYLMRKTLLNEASDFLPGDTLTIHISLNMKEHFMDIDYEFDVTDLIIFESAFKIETDSDGESTYLLSLDSKLAVYLCLASSYFRHLAATPMAESISRYVSIPADEFPYFMSIWKILKRESFMIDKCNYDISQLYVIGNKYDISHVTAACRNLLKAYISPENVTAVSELAEKYDDVYLKEIVENFKTCNEEIPEATSNAFQLQHENLKMEWTKPLKMTLNNFHHRKTVNQSDIKDEDQTPLSFYT